VFDIRAIDILGNEELTSGGLRIKNEEEEDYLKDLLEILPLIVFIVIIFLIIIVFVLFRRGTFSAWLGRVQTKMKDRETDSELDLDEELDDEDELELEERSPRRTTPRSRSSSHRGSRRKPQRATKKPLGDNTIDWFEEEKPPSILNESKSSKKPKKGAKARKISTGKGKPGKRKRPSVRKR
jgi:hypothetical protein